MSALITWLKVYVVRFRRTPRALPSMVNTRFTVRFAKDSAFAAAASTASWKVTPVACPPGIRPMFFGESKTRIAAAPFPVGVSVATTSFRSSCVSKFLSATEYVSVSPASRYWSWSHPPPTNDGGFVTPGTPINAWMMFGRHWNRARASAGRALPV